MDTEQISAELRNNIECSSAIDDEKLMQIYLLEVAKLIAVEILDDSMAKQQIESALTKVRKNENWPDVMEQMAPDALSRAPQSPEHDKARLVIRYAIIQATRDTTLNLENYFAKLETAVEVLFCKKKAWRRVLLDLMEETFLS